MIIGKALIFDSGTIINLSMNGLLYILPALKKASNCRFFITRAVKYETIDRPLNVLQFELGALRIRQLLEQEVLEMPDAIGISESMLNKETRRLMSIANHSVQIKGRRDFVEIVSEAEISCLALSSELTKRKIENMIAIDERTTRILSEDPLSLKKTMSRKLQQDVEILEDNFKDFAKFRFIRSSELVYVAYKKDLLNLEGDKALEAALYATKFKGSSISFEEINVLKKL